MELYGEVSSIMEDEETEENYAKVEMLVREIEEIVK